MGNAQQVKEGSASALVVALLAMAAGVSSVSCSGASSARPDDFFELLRFTRATQQNFTFAELFMQSSHVVVGKLEDVREGRTIDFATGASNPLRTVVFSVIRSRTVKGALAERDYIEYVRAPAVSVAQLRSSIPHISMLFFLVPADQWDRSVYKFDGEGRGVPLGAFLATFRNGQSLVIEDNGQLFQPLLHAPEDANVPGDLVTLNDAAVYLTNLPPAL